MSLVNNTYSSHEIDEYKGLKSENGEPLTATGAWLLCSSVCSMDFCSNLLWHTIQR